MDKVDFYDQEFQNQLREFCHNYQIPFLESNVPKTAKNAAKIYFRLQQDGESLSERFQNSKLMQFLTSVTAKDIDDSFNPFKMKEKWMKFFKGNYQKVVCDNDRVLKNTMNHNMVEFM